MSPDDEVCYCFHVSKRKLLNFLRIHKPRVASQMSECWGAGTGCGWCVPILKHMFANAGTGSAGDADALTADEYARRRAAYIRSGGGKPAPGATPLPPEAEESKS
jgi:NAD(P)H-nitrite reductase large subunit